MSPAPQNKDLIQVANHLQEFTDWFNASAHENDLGIYLDPRLSLVRVGNALSFATAHLMHAYESYRVTEEQVAAAVRMIAQTISKPGSSGLITSQQDGGSVGTAMMMMFAAPVCFLLSGTRLAPMYMTGNSYGRLGVARGEVAAFLVLYSELEIKVSSAGAGSGLSGSGANEDEFGLMTYLHDLLDADRYPSGLSIYTEVAQSVTARRMPGGLARNVEGLRQRASERGHELFIILEDSLYSSRTLSKSRKTNATLVHRALKELDADLDLGAKKGLVIGVSPGMIS